MLALRRALTVSARRSFATTVARREEKKVTQGKQEPEPDWLDHATGLEKKELLAYLRGDDDPFDMKIMTRQKGQGEVKDNPVLINSAYHERLIGCLCEEDAGEIVYMWLPKGEPKRCYCGYWFKLQYKAPL